MINGLSTHVNINGVLHEVILTDTSEAGLATYVVVGAVNNPEVSVSESIASNWVNVSKDSPTAVSGIPTVVNKQPGDGLVFNFANFHHLPVKEFRVLFSGSDVEGNTDIVFTDAGEQLKTTAVVSNVVDVSWFPNDYTTPLRNFISNTIPTPKGSKVKMLKVSANNYSVVSKQKEFVLDTSGQLDHNELFTQPKRDTKVESINGNVAFGMSVESKDGETAAILIGGRDGNPVRVNTLHKIGLGEI